MYSIGSDWPESYDSIAKVMQKQPLMERGWSNFIIA